MSDAWRDLNRALWDERVPIHVASAFYDVDAFLAGDSTLRSFEVEEVGDVAGLTLLHAQCHFGLDTLSWARRGARVTGLDFSAPAIEAAQLVERWARVMASLVAPGGRFYLAEFHPLSGVFADEDLTVAYPYFHTEPLAFDEPGTYADLEAPTVHNRSLEWIHGLGSVVSALIATGLRVEFLHEHDHTLFPRWPFLERAPDGTYRLPEGTPSLPLMYSLLASAP